LTLHVHLVPYVPACEHAKRSVGCSDPDCWLITQTSTYCTAVARARRVGDRWLSDESRACACSKAETRAWLAGAFWAPDGSSQILSTSYDDSVRIWDGTKKWAQTGMAKHNNQTGRWTSPFRAIWTPSAEGVIMGDMSRKLAFCDTVSASWSFKMLASEFVTAIPSRMCCHHKLPVVAAGTGSGRVHLWTT
jgi:hypothetical protein